MLLPKFSFWKGDWVLGYTCTQFSDFPKVSLFLKILCVKWLDNSVSGDNNLAPFHLH